MATDILVVGRWPLLESRLSLNWTSVSNHLLLNFLAKGAGEISGGYELEIVWW